RRAGIQKKADSYYITTGNLVEKEVIPKIQQQLDIINSFEAEDLKVYYKKILEDGSISDKGGAGLGLIEMARKSGNKLFYDFASINSKYSYFYLHTATTKETENNNKEVHVDLQNIKDIHKIINKESILIAFNGLFNQESLINLLSIIEGQEIKAIDQKKKIFNVMVEMLQNIVKHAAKPDNLVEALGNPGLFFLSTKNNMYTLSTGNYIENNMVDDLKTKLEHVNSLNGDELDMFYSKRLLNFEIDNSKEAGLGIIDLRIKSGKEIIYDFHKVNEKLSFFTLQISL
ncbi:MAG: SiaB family protein kinase, partial [Endomicrobiia bacterium]